jgi:alkylation response protein AidB-like acyl-CoA dehydrogenase
MNFLLTEEEKMLQAVVRDFVEREVKPRSRATDEAEEFDWEVWKGMAGLGLAGIGVDAKHGGTPGTHRQMALAIEEVSRGDAAASVSLLAHRSLSMETVLRFGNDAQKAKYIPGAAKGEKILAWALTEPGSGSDAAAMQTTAVKKGDHYVLNGSKMFITNGDIAEAVMVFATQDKSLRHKGVSAFIVDTGSEGFEAHKQAGKMGLRGSNTVELTFRDTPVPASNRLGEEGKGFRYAMEILDSSRIIIAAQSVGIAQGAFESAVRYAQQRKTFGKPIGEHQAIQFMLADMATDIYASQAMTLHAATLKDQGQPYLQEASMAKLYASEACFRVASKAVQIYGGIGYFKESDVERYFRDSRVTSIYEGTSEIQRLVIARQILEQFK